MVTQQSTEVVVNNSLSELSLDEIDSVNGGLIPLALAAAVLCTSVEFSFVVGIFHGSRNR